MNKMRKFSLGKLLDNNKVVFVISIVLAFAIWLGYSMYGGEQQERSLDVPIQMDSMTVPNQFNLQQFGEYSNSAVSVTIVGKKAVIGTVKPEDIRVVASTLDVNTAGKHTLPLSVSIESTKDFQIVSTNTLSVEVYFDTYKEVSLEVTTDLSTEPTVPDGYELGNMILSEDKLLAHGPSTEVSKIDKILAKAEIDETLNTTQTYPAEIVAVDQYGNEIQNIDIDNADDFTITIPVFKLAKLPVSVEFTNMPSGVTQDNLDIQYSVSTLNIAGEATTIDKMETVSIGTIDFSELKNSKNTFRFDASSIPGIKVKSKVGDIVVNVDLSSFKSKQIRLPISSVEIINSTDLKVNITSEDIALSVAGLTDSVSSITASDLTASVKLDENTKKGENQTLELSVRVNNVNGIWVVGQYEVTADIS
ncbi:MAG: hypothetical protein IJG23_01610 [Clostridia bacterium]|nr:hypothetical protein [Clostridia bacterium]